MSPDCPDLVEAPSEATTTDSIVLAGSTWTMAQYVLPQLYIVVQSVVAARFLAPPTWDARASSPSWS